MSRGYWLPQRSVSRFSAVNCPLKPSDILDHTDNLPTLELLKTKISQVIAETRKRVDNYLKRIGTEVII